MVKKLTTEEFIDRAVSIHENRYDYTSVVYQNKRQQIVIICRSHGAFLQQAGSHLRGRGCKDCAISSRADKHKSSRDEFIRRSKEVHGDRFSYESVRYTGATNKVSIICNIHGVFEQRAADHIRGIGCCLCSGRSKSDTREFIKKAKSVHSDKYDYSLVEYTNSKSKVSIICSKHGEFSQAAGSHLAGQNCPACYKLDFIKFVKRARLVHGNQYDYSLVDFVTTKHKVVITCRSHGQFDQRVNDHLDGAGCPRCARTGFSKVQIQWLSFLEKYYDIHIQHIGNSAQEHRIKSTGWKADGYCKKTNTIYEFHGDFWHGNPKLYDPQFMNAVCKRTMKTLYDRTLKREQKIKDLGYSLVVMWELDWTRINDAIKLCQRRFRGRFIVETRHR